ncbi:MAG TPA: nitrilase-related carbon-nitrogen hydrolase [Desulfatiglandales bacterium]|nr:nitrilase-related carbon-nitrogen hydrolase [Desulfatiglandales bacterium]
MSILNEEKKVTVAAIQMTSDSGNREKVFKKTMNLIDRAGEQGARIVVLPEHWQGGMGQNADYPYHQFADTIPGEITDKLCEKAKKYNFYITGSMFEKDNSGTYYNTCPFVNPKGEIIGKYRKTHLADFPTRDDVKAGINESDKVSPGIAFPLFDTEFGKIGIFVCSDLRFPEVARIYAISGAKILLFPSAFLSPRIDHWEFFLRARACENQVFIIAAGQYGTEPIASYTFVGRSMIIDPWGVILATAPDSECALIHDINLNQINQVRHKYDLLSQRKAKLYKPITCL